MMKEVVTAVLKTSLSELHGRHWNMPFFIIGVTSIQPPGIDLSRDAPISTILLEFIGLIWLPHRVDLFIDINDICGNIDGAVREPVPGEWPNRGQVSRWFTRMVLSVICKEFPGGVA